MMLAKHPCLLIHYGPIKMVGAEGLEPPIDVIARTNYVSTVYKTASLHPIEMKS